MDVKHGNNLSITISDTLQYKKTDSGFVVYPEGGLDRRSPIQVFVNFKNNKHQAADWDSSKKIEGREIFYREYQHNEGSGGTELLETSIPLEAGYIETSQDVQLELTSNPDFSLSWQIISKAHIAK